MPGGWPTSSCVRRFAVSPGWRSRRSRSSPPGCCRRNCERATGSSGGGLSARPSRPAGRHCRASWLSRPGRCACCRLPDLRTGGYSWRRPKVVRIASAGQYSTATLAAILAVALIAYLLWRKYRRRGQRVRDAEIAPAVAAVLGRLLGGKTSFVVMSVSPSVYLQFASEPNGAVLVEANCPADKPAAERVLSTAGLGAVQGPPNYRGNFARADVGRLSSLARDYIHALGAASISIRSGR